MPAGDPQKSEVWRNRDDSLARAAQRTASQSSNCRVVALARVDTIRPSVLTLFGMQATLVDIETDVCEGVVSESLPLWEFLRDFEFVRGAEEATDASE